MDNTAPIFVVGSGRCGTASLAKALSIYDTIEVHHEYAVVSVQVLGFNYYHNFYSSTYIKNILFNIYQRAIYYCNKPIWMDCSNKISWLIKPITDIFPNARFVWLVRDGRKVVSSFYHKLGMECYDDRSVSITKDWMRSFVKEESKPEPPLEKKYWWPLPPNCLEMSQFERICWHWNCINRFILWNTKHFSPERLLRLKLEQLTSQNYGRIEVKRLLDFIGVPFREEVVESFRIPHNVSEPVDYQLTDEQDSVFWRYCKPMMSQFNYSNTQKTYTVNYHPLGYMR